MIEPSDEAVTVLGRECTLEPHQNFPQWMWCGQDGTNLYLVFSSWPKDSPRRFFCAIERYEDAGTDQAALRWRFEGPFRATAEEAIEAFSVALVELADAAKVKTPEPAEGSGTPCDA